ncbi:MAG: AbrB/MazE/SpoVT family DNA-binding domain-containing protein [Chloroflexi bacterium]|nr:AbrB/MazE/SpoVT family DNA-binding domain-containing protein [Chloroflexota bacterium]
MATVTISPKFQVVIPKDCRESLGLKPGQKVEAFPYEGRIQLVPVEPIEELRGFLAGIDSRVDREDDRL